MKSQHVADGWNWPLPFCSLAAKPGWALQPLQFYTVAGRYGRAIEGRLYFLFPQIQDKRVFFPL